MLPVLNLILQGLCRLWWLDVVRIPTKWAGAQDERHCSQVDYDFEHYRGRLSKIGEAISSWSQQIVCVRTDILLNIGSAP